ncbi:hypothetical protein [Treponema sp.]|uniref:hypothetical protein n=1 Tax=Treponema sp. TaxID=166 RepID=UPI003FA219F5
MPQISKGGKYIFGWVQIREHGEITFPPQAIEEYKLQKEGLSRNFSFWIVSLI